MDLPYIQYFYTTCTTAESSHQSTAFNICRTFSDKMDFIHARDLQSVVCISAEHSLLNSCNMG